MKMLKPSQFNSKDWEAYDSLIETGYTVFNPDGGSFKAFVQWPLEPGYDALKELLKPLLNGAELEHVSVLHDGKAADMFVDEVGELKALSRNETATGIYRTAYLARNPNALPEELAAIYGPAILFDRRVWY